jgi:hypothetical protein
MPKAIMAYHRAAVFFGLHTQQHQLLHSFEVQPLGGSDDRAGHDGTSAASDTGLECTVTVNVLAGIIF